MLAKIRKKHLGTEGFIIIIVDLQYNERKSVNWFRHSCGHCFFSLLDIKKLKPQKDCCINQKTNFMETKSFLTIVTILAISMLSFPSFSGNFYDNTPIEQSAITDSSKVVLNIEGMTCGGCESQINGVLNKTEGVISCNASYKDASVTIIYDKEVTDSEGLSKIISKKTKFKVIGIKDE